MPEGAKSDVLQKYEEHLRVTVQELESVLADALIMVREFSAYLLSLM